MTQVYPTGRPEVGRSANDPDCVFLLGLRYISLRVVRRLSINLARLAMSPGLVRVISKAVMHRRTNITKLNEGDARTKESCPAPSCTTAPP